MEQLSGATALRRAVADSSMMQEGAATEQLQRLRLTDIEL